MLADKDMEFNKWTEMEVYEWAFDNYCKETANCFKGKYTSSVL